jgi:hypothetical protein
MTGHDDLNCLRRVAITWRALWPDLASQIDAISRTAEHRLFIEEAFPPCVPVDAVLSKALDDLVSDFGSLEFNPHAHIGNGQPAGGRGPEEGNGGGRIRHVANVPFFG